MEGQEGVPARALESLHPSVPSEGPAMNAMQDNQYEDTEDDATHQQGQDHLEGEDEDGSSEAGSEEEGGLVFGHSDQPLPTSECERKKQRISCLECSQAKTLCDKEFPCGRCVKRGTVCVERFRLVRVPPQPGDKKKYKKKKGKRKFTPVIKPRKSAPKAAKVYGATELPAPAAAFSGMPQATHPMLHPTGRPLAPAFHKDLPPHMTGPVMSGPSYPRGPTSYPYPSSLPYPPYPRAPLGPINEAQGEAMPLRHFMQPPSADPAHPPGPPPFASQYPPHLQTWDAPYNEAHRHSQAGPYPAWQGPYPSRAHPGYPAHHCPPSQPYPRMDMPSDGGSGPRQATAHHDELYEVEAPARVSKRPLSAVVKGPRPQEEEEGASAMLMMATVAATRVKLGAAEERGEGEEEGTKREASSDARATALQVADKGGDHATNVATSEEEDEEEESEEGRGEEKGEDEEEGTAMDAMSHATVGADSATLGAGGDLGADDEGEGTAIPIERLRRDCDALADSLAKELEALRGRDRENKALLEQERTKTHKLQTELKMSKADEARSASALEAERKLRIIFEEKLRVMEEKQAELMTQLEAEKKRANLSQEEAAAAKEEVMKLQKHIRAALWQEEAQGQKV